MNCIIETGTIISVPKANDKRITFFIEGRSYGKPINFFVMMLSERPYEEVKKYIVGMRLIVKGQAGIMCSRKERIVSILTDFYGVDILPGLDKSVEAISMPETRDINFLPKASSEIDIPKFVDDEGIPDFSGSGDSIPDFGDAGIPEGV